MANTTTTSKTNANSPRPPVQPGTGRGSTIGARLWGAALGLMLAAAGALICWYLWLAYQNAKLTDHWVRTPCEVIANHVDDSQVNQHGMPKFKLLISYRYEFEGELRVSNQVRRRPLTSTSPDKIDQWLEKYPLGMKTTCLVNPDDANEAILKPNSKAPLYTMWFPGMFLIGGIGIAVRALVGRSSGD